MSRHDDAVSLRQMLDHIEEAAHPEIPWREIIGTRNRLIHGYDAVDYDILWEIVSADFPPLAGQLKPILDDQAMGGD